MREQTTYAIMFGSRNHLTLEALFEAYGGMYPNLKEFTAAFHEVTYSQGPYTAMVYIEAEDSIENNYIGLRAPAKFESIKI